MSGLETGPGSRIGCTRVLPLSGQEEGKAGHLLGSLLGLGQALGKDFLLAAGGAGGSGGSGGSGMSGLLPRVLSRLLQVTLHIYSYIITSHLISRLVYYHYHYHYHCVNYCCLLLLLLTITAIAAAGSFGGCYPSHPRRSTGVRSASDNRTRATKRRRKRAITRITARTRTRATTERNNHHHYYSFYWDVLAGGVLPAFVLVCA